MKHTICAHALRNSKSNWILRFSGLFFIYIGLFFGPGETLKDTLLMDYIRVLYPSWSFVINDIIATIFGLALLTIIVYIILYQQKKKHGPKKSLKKLKVLDTYLLKMLLNIFSFITRWCIGLVISILIVLILSTFMYVPLYMIQPVLYTILVLGITFIIESFPFWQRKLNRFFCI